jgi:hypothetical protein
MKKILLSSLLFLLPVSTFAEKRIWFGISTGLAPYTLPLNNKSNFEAAFSKSGDGLPLYLAGNVLYNLRENYQLGLQISLSTFYYTVNFDRLIFVKTNITPNTRLTSSTRPIASTAIPITILFNRILNPYSAIKCYVGVEAGYERYSVHSPQDGTSISGVLGGAHFGIMFNENHAVRLNAHVAADYHYSYTDGIHYKIIGFPVTVGLVF